MDLTLILLKVQPGREAEAMVVFSILFIVVAWLFTAAKNSLKNTEKHPIRSGFSVFFGIPIAIFLIVLIIALLFAAFTE